MVLSRRTLLTCTLFLACSSAAPRAVESEPTDEDDEADAATTEEPKEPIDFVDAATPPPSTKDGGCSAPVDMFIQLDRSTSMATDTYPDGNIGDTHTKWSRAITALSGYFHSTTSTSHAAALQFFPKKDFTTPMCATGKSYDISRIPGGGLYKTLPSGAFDNELNAEAPAPVNTLPTPVEAALRGMITYTATNRNPGRVTIGVLITDGSPTACDWDVDHLAALIKAHRDATKIRTYVIGMTGASFPNLEKLAIAGGGPIHPDNMPGITNACGGLTSITSCQHWNVASGDPNVFTAALSAIQDSADGCKPGGGVPN